MKVFIETPRVFNDQRGHLVEFLKSSDLPANKKKFGEIYFVNFIKKGIVRGNHYHRKKTEWLGIAYGRVRVVLEDIKTGKRKSYILNDSARNYRTVRLGKGVAHAVKSLSAQAVLIDYFNTEYDDVDPDSYPYQVI